MNKPQSSTENVVTTESETETKTGLNKGLSDVLYPILGLLAVFLITAWWVGYSLEKEINLYKSEWDTYREISTPKAAIGKACDENKQNCIDAIILRGQVSDGMLSAFLLLLEDNNLDVPDTVCLDSGGGGTLIGEVISRFIRKREMNTCIASTYQYPVESGIPDIDDGKIECASMCPFLLLAGNNRFGIGQNFTLSVHSPGNGKFAFYLGDGKFSIFGVKRNAQYTTLSGNPMYRIAVEGEPEHIDFFNLAMATPFTAPKLDCVEKEEIESMKVFTAWNYDESVPIDMCKDEKKV